VYYSEKKKGEKGAIPISIMSKRVELGKKIKRALQLSFPKRGKKERSRKKRGRKQSPLQEKKRGLSTEVIERAELTALKKRKGKKPFVGGNEYVGRRESACILLPSRKKEGDIPSLFRRKLGPCFGKKKRRKKGRSRHRCLGKKERNSLQTEEKRREGRGVHNHPPAGKGKGQKGGKGGCCPLTEGRLSRSKRRWGQSLQTPPAGKKKEKNEVDKERQVIFSEEKREGGGAPPAQGKWGGGREGRGGKGGMKGGLCLSCFSAQKGKEKKAAPHFRVTRGGKGKGPSKRGGTKVLILL